MFTVLTNDERNPEFEVTYHAVCNAASNDVSPLFVTKLEKVIILIRLILLRVLLLV